MQRLTASILTRVPFQAPKRKRDEFSSSEEDSDSDFEDPDEIEVPGGGRNLQTIQRLKTGDQPGPSSAGNRLTGDVTSAGPSSSSSARSLLRTSMPGLPRATPKVAAGGSNIPVFDVPDDDPGLEIIKEVPGNSSSLLAGAGRGALGLRGAGGMPYMGASVLAAQDPFQLTNPTDLLQKCE